MVYFICLSSCQCIDVDRSDFKLTEKLQDYLQLDLDSPIILASCPWYSLSLHLYFPFFFFPEPFKDKLETLCSSTSN